MLTSELQMWTSYAKVLAALREQSVVHAVAGGIAVNLWGFHRPTCDLDLLIRLEPENLERFLDVMQQLGYEPRLPVPASMLLNAETREDWIANRNMLAFSFWNPRAPMETVDFLLAHSRQDELLQGALDIDHGGTPVRVVSLFDLIEMKRESDREHDQQDVGQLVDRFITVMNQPIYSRAGSAKARRW